MLSGELNPGAIGNVWEEIAAGEMTGMLAVIAGKEQWDFSFREGVMTGAHKRGINNAEHAVELMLDAGILRHETVRDALKKQSKVMKSCLDILMEEGHVPLILYSRIISASMRLYLLDVLALSKGHYQFAVKDDMREDPGAKPLDAARFNAFRDRFEHDHKMLKQVRDALFSPIEMLIEVSFPLDRKTLFYSYSTQDRDLFDFLVRMAELIKSGSLTTDRGIWSAAPRDLVAALLLRGAALFMTAAVLAAVFIARPKSDTAIHEVNTRAARHKVFLLSELYLFDTGEPADTDRLVRAGLITQSEAATVQTDDPTNPQ
ncbi:MAG TPA: hypothetical protein PLV42_12205 [bacterium]|nr:hypothetical protein [bacterium]